MLVDKMTESEVCNEIIEDFGNITQSLRLYIPKVNRVINKKRNEIPFNVLYAYTSPLKNNWILIFRVFHKKIRTPDKFKILNVLIHETTHGAYAYHVDFKNKVVYSLFPPHFFKRYAERFNLDMHGKELIKHFFSNNIYFPIKILKDKNGKDYLVGCFADGVGLGEITELGNYLFKTFITYDLAMGNQINEFESLNIQRELLLSQTLNNKKPYVKANDFINQHSLLDLEGVDKSKISEIMKQQSTAPVGIKIPNLIKKTFVSSYIKGVANSNKK